MKLNFGVPIVSILTCAFILAKVFEYGPIAAWSWVWVLSPLWISAALWLAIILIFLLLAVIFNWRWK